MVDPITITGYLAASLVGATFYMKSMVSLRTFAIASNVCFIVYAYCSSPQLYPVLVLHVFLLPLNAHRLWRLKRNRQHEFQRNRYSNSLGPVYRFTSDKM